MNLDESHLLEQINAFCKQIARGEYACLRELEALSIEGRYPKMISELAESFSFMLVKLEAREFQLKETIKELEQAKRLLKKQNLSLKEELRSLKIDIDKMKQSEEVEKIAESELFQEIKEKAKERRKKK